MLSRTGNIPESEASHEIVLIATRKDRTTKIRRGLHGVDYDVEINYAEISGKGPPPRHLGSPGDIYIDISSKPCELYGRMASTWSKLLTPSHIVIHPLWPSLYLHYITGSTPIWNELVLRPSTQRDSEGRIPSATQPAKSRSNTKRKLDQVWAPSINGTPKKAKSNGSEKLPKHALSFFQQFSKSFQVHAIPENAPRSFTLHGPGIYTIQFSHFWSSSFPSAEVGSPGDMFFVVSTAIHSILIKKDQWVQWDGVSSRPLESQITHPNFPDMIVQFDETDLIWATYKNEPSDPGKLPTGYNTVTTTADDCVRKILRNTPLRPSNIAGPYKVGGSLLYWRTEYIRVEIRCERLVQENLDLKNRIADMQHLRLDDMIRTSSESDAEILVKMKEAFIQNPNYRNLVLKALAEALSPFLPTPDASHQVQSSPQDPHTSRPLVLPATSVLLSGLSAHLGDHIDERNISHDPPTSAPPEDPSTNGPVVTSVNHNAESVQPVGLPSTHPSLETTTPETTGLLDGIAPGLGNSDTSTPSSIVEGSSGITAQNSSNGKAQDEQVNQPHGNEPLALPAANVLSPGLMISGDERSVYRDLPTSAAPEDPSTNDAVITPVDHEVEPVQLLGPPSTHPSLETTNTEVLGFFDNSAPGLGHSDTSTSSSVVEGPSDITDQSPDVSKTPDKVPALLDVGIPHDQTPAVDPAEKEQPLESVSSVDEVFDSSATGSSEAVSETNTTSFEAEGGLASGERGVEPRVAEVISSPSCDMDGSLPSTEGFTSLGEVHIERESAGAASGFSMSYLDVVYHVLEVSKARVCRLCLQLSPPQVAQFSPAVSEQQLIQHSEEKHAAMNRLLVEMSPEQLSAILAKMSAVSQQTKAPHSNRMSTSASV